MAKFIAIDLEVQGLFAVAGNTARGGSATVEQAVAWDGTDGEPPPPLAADTAKRLGEQLRDRLRAAGVAPALALVSVGRDRVILKELKYPKVPPADEPNVVRFQALKELSDAPDDVVLDYAPVHDPDAPAGEQRSMAVVLRKEVFAAVQAMCNAAGLKAVAVTARPYAVAAGLTRAFAAGAAPAPAGPGDAVAALTLGPAGGEFTVCRKGEVTFTRSLGAPAVTSDALLVAEVRRNLTVYAGQHPAHPVQGVYVAEAGGRWAGRLRSALGVAVHSYDPLAGAAPAVPEAARGRFAGAAGLLAAKAADAVPINFAAPRQPRAATDPNKTRLLVGVLAALILFAGGALWGYLKLDAADNNLGALRRQKDDLTKQVAASESDTKLLAAVKGWQARRVSWLDELFDLTDRFPVAGGFYASSFTGRALPPDAKTGKQENQATIEVKVTARNSKPVNDLVAAFDRDAVNPTPDPRAPNNPANPSRFYVGADKTTGGPSQGDPTSQDSTIFAKVNARPAAAFVRAPQFTPPPRKNYPPPVAAKEPKEPKEPKDREPEPEPKPTEKGPGTAPGPKEKAEAGGG